jgi:hypothetical protein
MEPWNGLNIKTSLFFILTRLTRKAPLPWMPTDLKLCRSCFRFIHLGADYWDMMLRKEFDDKEIRWSNILGWMDPAVHGYEFCLFCAAKRYRQYSREGHYVSERTREPNLRFPWMSAALCRRIDQPWNWQVSKKEKERGFRKTIHESAKIISFGRCDRECWQSLKRASASSCSASPECADHKMSRAKPSLHAFFCPPILVRSSFAVVLLYSNFLEHGLKALECYPHIYTYVHADV